MPASARAALLGASGHAAADLLRIGASHPGIDFVALTSDAHAGRAVASLFPQLTGARLPDLVTVNHVDWRSIDVVFSCLPHGAGQAVVKNILSVAPRARIIDLSADYRLRDVTTYQKWYGTSHAAPQLQQLAAYGLTEHNRDAIRAAPIVAGPGSYPTAALIALAPLVAAGAILIEDIIIDGMAGSTWSGRGAAAASFVPEGADSIAPTAAGGHRHLPEIEQELSIAARRPVTVSFTPHRVPTIRGVLVTAHVRLGNTENAVELNDILANAYAGEPFVRLAARGELPATGNVRGSNVALIGAFDDRLKRRAVVVAALDNLVKGSAGQAIQNFNVAFDWPETTGLEALPLFP
jgi:N-acetyl-gamma-glutamyl-phosphate reductase